MPSEIKTRAVVFDVGRVLVQWDIAHLYDRLIADPGERAWFLANVVTEEWHFRHDAGESLDAMVGERQAEFPGHADLIEAYRTHWLDTVPGPVPGSQELAVRLDEAGIPLFAITNFGVDTWDMFRPTQPLFDRFRDIVVSGREKVMKPDPEIFQIARRRFDHPPGSMLFIDDNAANVASARALGWQTHHFHDADMLEADLTRRGLLA